MFQFSRGRPRGVFDTFREQGLPNMCPDVNIRLKSSLLFVRWQLSDWIKLYFEVLIIKVELDLV